MKRALLLCSVLVLLCFISSPGFAQVTVGFGAGLNYGYVRHNFQDSEHQKEIRKLTYPTIGFNVGVLANYQLSKFLSLQTGLNWTNKGQLFKEREKDANGEVTYKERTSVNFLELPVLAAVSVRRFQVFAGPYLGVGLTGSKKNTYDAIISGVPESNEETFRVKFRQTLPADFTPQHGEIYMRRLDYGLHGGFGYKAGPALVRASIAWGLANLYTRQEGDTTYGDNKSFYVVPSLSVVYFFGE